MPLSPISTAKPSRTGPPPIDPPPIDPPPIDPPRTTFRQVSSPARRSAAPQGCHCHYKLPGELPGRLSWRASPARRGDSVRAYMALAATLFVLSASNPSRLVTAVGGRV